MLETTPAPTDGRPYQMCTRCVMDTTDPDLTFDAEGVCRYCHYFENEVKKVWWPNEEGRRKLDAIVARIKEEGKGKEYDCVMGLSGGVDSSYVAYVAKKELGLRPLAVHVDAGWNSELAVKNIENIVKKLDIDLFTYVVDWEEMKDLHLAFLKAGVPNQDIPQDHVFTAATWKMAKEKGVKTILSGGNWATESILPRAWGFAAMDLHHIKAIHRQFGQKKQLKSFLTLNFFEYYLYYPRILGIQSVRPLNYMPFHKAEAMQVLTTELDWRYYGGKHYESRFTKFFQGYYLPKKFGYDKRKAHLASLIVSGQMTREEALAELEKPIYPPEELAEDLTFIAKKLGLSEAELQGLIAAPNKRHMDYPSNARWFALKDRLKAKLGR